MHVWIKLHAFSVILVPLVVSTIFNVILIFLLKKTELPGENDGEDNTTRQKLLATRARNETKVTGIPAKGNVLPAGGRGLEYQQGELGYQQKELGYEQKKLG